METFRGKTSAAPCPSLTSGGRSPRHHWPKVFEGRGGRSDVIGLQDAADRLPEMRFSKKHSRS
jgi:hypothetical protein